MIIVEISFVGYLSYHLLRKFQQICVVDSHLLLLTIISPSLTAWSVDVIGQSVQIIVYFILVQQFRPILTDILLIVPRWYLF